HGLRSNAFEQVTGKRPNPNLRALDDELIVTISKWKRNLSAELGNVVPNEAFSALFNAIILARAVEDQRQRISPAENNLQLLAAWDAPARATTSLRAVLRRHLEQLNGQQVPTYL